jgi:hypothetical protein
VKKKKPKLGPPFKKAEDVRDKRLVVRLTSTEEKEVMSHANNADISVSTLVRWGLAHLGLNISRK